jgi:hypothetical protein
LATGRTQRLRVDIPAAESCGKQRFAQLTAGHQSATLSLSGSVKLMADRLQFNKGKQGRGQLARPIENTNMQGFFTVRLIEEKKHAARSQRNEDMWIVWTLR